MEHDIGTRSINNRIKSSDVICLLTNSYLTDAAGEAGDVYP